MENAPVTRPQFGWFHITNLGVDHADIFDTPLDHVVFEHEVQIAAGRFGVEIHAYCWMDNHFHLIVNCPDGNLSRFMQHFEQQYVLKHNRAIGRSGPLFVSRFSAFPVGLDDDDPDDGVCVLARYVHRNPLDVIPIEELAGYRYSSYGIYLGLRTPPDWMRTDVLHDIFGRSSGSLRTFTERSHPSDRTPRAGRRHRPFHIDDVLAAVATTMGVTVDELCTSTTGRQRLDRPLAAALVGRLRPTSEADLREVFGVDSRRSVQRLIAKGRALIGSDESFARRADRAMDLLWQADDRGQRAA